ncbi:MULTISPECIES: alpha/beta hydrolase family protein [unclassified Caulobacter]|uniref:alpha/beta hydrolase family protein n=1 Tax=unclassified Caulobacter TaxID=2648921 RepID=UPI000D39C5AB|nr:MULTISPECIES: S9 family peptidase [unclassified Caulobacter]PTS81798.1 S9 family peptidase [Caulobacter sp. HMWF009]PTT06891.1 S9 family peptidase [Caulobacter sp. HMWF025]
MISRRQAIAGAVVAPAMFGGIAVAQPVPQGPVPPTIEEFLKPEMDRDAALSPDGKRIAILTSKTVGEKTTATVTLLNADAPDTGRLTLPLGEMEVLGVYWANETRLLIKFRMYAQVEQAQTGARVKRQSLAQKGLPVHRLVAIDADGQNSKILFDDGTAKLRELFDLANVVDMLRDDPRSILMQAWNADFGAWWLYKVDVYSGKPQVVERGELKTWTWQTQNGVPVLRYDGNERGTVMSIFVRPPGAKNWTFYRTVRRGDWAKLDFNVVGPTKEPGVMLAASRADEKDTLVLRKFDLATMALGEIVSAPAGKDVDVALFTPGGDLLAAGYVDDRRAYQFIDPAFGAHFRALNKYLGNENNIFFFDVSGDGTRFLARVTGPREPGSHYFYDRTAKRFDALGQSKPWLTQERLARIETLPVKTRDGAAITAYLTVPLATGPRPLVVMPHGGPEVRDSVDYDAFAQVLAAQGWLVLQPNFRGSGGYGKAFADAGRKHWGDRMQEDVEDAVAQVVATGRVESGKIAICGYSYGAYAALMGAVRKPDLYKAVVAIAGDSDLHETIAFAKAEEGVDSPAYLYWLDTIGDPATDGEMMRAASPALHADRVKAPVLLMHGTDDQIVSPKQSRIMAQALKAAGKPVEHIEIKGRGHRDLEEDDWKLVYTKTVAHIARAFSA